MFNANINDLVAGNNVWLSFAINEALSGICQMTLEILKKNPNFDKLTPEDIFALTMSYITPLQDKVSELYHIFFKDIKELDNIRKFKKVRTKKEKIKNDLRIYSKYSRYP